MRDEKVEFTVTLYDIHGFLRKYPRFKKFAHGDGKALFDEIMKKEVFIEASVLANYGYPSVLAVAKKCHEIIVNSDDLNADSLIKQFIGSVICTLMEANGYKKTGTKKSVPHELFSVGEFYERNSSICKLDSIQLCGSERLVNRETIALHKEINVSWAG